MGKVGEGTEIGVSGEESRGEWEREQGSSSSQLRFLMYSLYHNILIGHLSYIV